MVKPILRIMAIILLVSLLGTMIAVPVLGANLKGGDVIVISKEDVINDDLYIGARSIIIDGTVNGDIFAVAQDIVINGVINGGVTIAARTITITGTVTAGARIVGQTINVSGKISRDLLAAGSDFNLSSTGNVQRDLLFGSQTALIGGSVDGNVKGSANSVTISNKVGGDVELIVNQLNLANTTEIRGVLSYKSNNPANVQSGAKVIGKINRSPQERKGPDIGGKILGFLMIGVTGIIIVLLVGSKKLTQIADSIHVKPWPSLGWGSLALIATPIASIIVMVTVIGIPLGLIAIALYTIAIYLSQIPVALIIGRLILGSYVNTQTTARTIAALALGLTLLLIVGFIPFLGELIGFLTIIFGLGSLVVWIWSHKCTSSTQVIQPT